MSHPSPDQPGSTIVATMLAAALLACAVQAASRSVRLPIDAAPTQVAAPSWPDARVDLNRAGAAELTLLPGIGPRLAQRIVANRAANGPFESVDDLARVSRIGPATVRRLRPFAVAAPDAGG